MTPLFIPRQFVGRWILQRIISKKEGHNIECYKLHFSEIQNGSVTFSDSYFSDDEVYYNKYNLMVDGPTLYNDIESFRIIETDYTNYAILLSCSFEKDSEYKLQWSTFILLSLIYCSFQILYTPPYLDPPF